jgi:aldehyde:ferredoxin oxidoreductase
MVGTVNKGYGWAGTILRVDLTKRKITKVDLAKDLAYNYIGGRGINGKFVYDEVPVGLDPLSPENRLCLCAGLLSGTLFPAGRWNSTTKSALTGIFGDGNGGGHWSPELKHAGYDNIIIHGRSEKPVYLWIQDDDVELRDASSVWGHDNNETLHILKKDLGDNEIKVVSIGQAGENLVRFSCIIADLARAPGRAGAGAVMGSKNLKAVAVRGTKGIKVARPEAFEKLYEAFFNETRTDDPVAYHRIQDYGTMLGWDRASHMGIAGLKHWQTTETTDENMEEISSYSLQTKYAVKQKGCNNCLNHCSHYYAVHEGPYAGLEGEGMEWEAQCDFGGRTECYYLPAVMMANTLVNRYGMDVCSTGNVVGLAMHLWQEGVITAKDTDGLDLSWGNHESMIKLIHMIALRKGIGNLLAEGDLNAARKLGQEHMVIHCKGLSPISFELRGYKGVALGFATSTRGADHLRSYVQFQGGSHQTLALAEKIFGGSMKPWEYDTVGLPRAVKFYSDMNAVRDCLEICTMYTGNFLGSSWYNTDASEKARSQMADFAKWISALTGVEMSEQHLWECGERVWTQEAAFNWREGLNRVDDLFSRGKDRWHTEPLPSGPWKGELLDVDKFNKMLDGYYKVREWDIETGIATREKLENLGLKYIADELEKLGKLPKAKAKEPREGEKKAGRSA